VSAPRKVLLLGAAAVFPGVVAKWGVLTLVLGWIAGPFVLLGCGVVLVRGQQTVGGWSLRRLVFVAVGLAWRQPTKPSMLGQLGVWHFQRKNCVGKWRFTKLCRVGLIHLLAHFLKGAHPCTTANLLSNQLD